MFQHAAGDHTRGNALEFDVHGRADAFVGRDATEVDMEDGRAEVIMLDFLNQHGLLLAGDFDGHGAGVMPEQRGQRVLANGDVGRCFLVAVNHGRNATMFAKSGGIATAKTSANFRLENL